MVFDIEHLGNTWLLVVRNAPYKEVSHRVASSVAAPAQVESPVAAVTDAFAGLQVLAGVPVSAALDRVLADNFGDVVVDGWILLGSAEALTLKAPVQVHFLDVGIGTAPRSFHVRNLAGSIAKESGDVEAESAAIHCGRVAQGARVDVFRPGKHKFVGGGGTENVGQIDHDFLRGGGCLHCRRIRQNPRWSPPDTDRVLIVLNLARIRSRQLGVVSDRVINLSGPFPAILGDAAYILIVVPAV